MKNAEKSAAAIAQAYGKPLGAVKNVSEISRNYYYMNTDSNAKSSMMATEDAVADGGLGTTISYGKIEITANIATIAHIRNIIFAVFSTIDFFLMNYSF